VGDVVAELRDESIDAVELALTAQEVLETYLGRLAVEVDIDIEQVKWVVLMVLFSQPGQENAYERMEDLVFEERRDAMH